MLALGIVLIVLAVLFGLGVSVSSGDSTTMSVFGVDFGLAVPTLFFLGLLAGVAVTLGLWLTKKGLGRELPPAQGGQRAPPAGGRYDHCRYDHCR